MLSASKKKKVDYEALNSPFMRIPHMKVEGARALLDLKFKEIYELKGRAPEAMFDDLSKIRLKADKSILPLFVLAVNFAENQE
ncbi:MAG: hypothetical protein HP060_00905 [Opitutales bacterium]|nr:hypothetical protein [Opitutales bacterium]